MGGVEGVGQEEPAGQSLHRGAGEEGGEGSLGVKNYTVINYTDGRLPASRKIASCNYTSRGNITA